jgi:hypothetical protein
VDTLGEGAPWDRQAGETVRAWAAFRAYRDQPGQERSIARVPAILSKGPGYGRVCERFSSRWRWVDRLKAWDAHIDALAQTESADGAVHETRRAAEIASRGLRLVSDRLDTLRPEDLSPREVALIGEMALRMARTSWAAAPSTVIADVAAVRVRLLSRAPAVGD